MTSRPAPGGLYLRLGLLISTMRAASPILKDDLRELYEGHAATVDSGEICRTGWWLVSKIDEAIGIIEASTG